jgi:hypothetical protein
MPGDSVVHFEPPGRGPDNQQVPSGCYLVVGDNEVGIDGPAFVRLVPRTAIVGRASTRLWPGRRVGHA